MSTQLTEVHQIRPQPAAILHDHTPADLLVRYEKDLRDEGHSEVTIRYYLTTARQVMDTYPGTAPRDMQPTQLAQFLQPFLNPWTRARKWREMRTFFKYLQTEGIVDRNPVNLVDCPTEAQCREYTAQHRAHAAPRAPEPQGHLIQEFEQMLKARNYAPATVGQYRREAEKFFRCSPALDPKHVTRQDIERYIYALPVGPRTKGDRVIPLKAFFRWLQEDKSAIDRNPCEGVKKPRWKARMRRRRPMEILKQSAGDAAPWKKPCSLSSTTSRAYDCGKR